MPFLLIMHFAEKISWCQYFLCLLYSPIDQHCRRIIQANCILFFIHIRKFLKYQKSRKHAQKTKKQKQLKIKRLSTFLVFYECNFHCKNHKYNNHFLCFLTFKYYKLEEGVGFFLVTGSENLTGDLTDRTSKNIKVEVSEKCFTKNLCDLHQLKRIYGKFA